MIQSQISVRLTRQQWGVLCLLLVSVWINYIDRGNLSVAAPLLAPELNLTPVQMGLLLSSFLFWSYPHQEQPDQSENNIWNPDGDDRRN